MDVSLAISPLAGAVIGYFTNYVAIKMLFRPYNQINIGPFKLPFTPGLIPKEKKRIATSLGKAVGEKILTNDTIKEYLLEQNIIDYIGKEAENKLADIKNNKYTLNDAGNLIFGENWEGIKESLINNIYFDFTEFLKCDDVKYFLADNVNFKINELLQTKAEDLKTENIIDFIEYVFNVIFKDLIDNGKLQSSAEKTLWKFLISFENDQRLLKEITSFSTVSELKDYISLKIPDVVNYIISLTENPQTEQVLKQHLQRALESLTGPFIGMFINSDDIYCKIITDITEYFNNPENSGEIEKVVSSAVDDFMEKSISDISSLILSQLREKSVNKLVMFLFEEFKNNLSKDGLNGAVKNYITKNSDKTLNEIISSVDENFENKIKDFVFGLIDFILNNISGIVEQENCKKAIDVCLNTEINEFLNKLSINDDYIVSICVSFYKKAASDFAVKFISKLNISNMAEKKINTFEMGYLEEIILSIAKKELSAITYLGGVLGFVIGLLPCVISLI